MDNEALKKLFESLSKAKGLTKKHPAREWTPEYRELAEEVFNSFHAALEAGLNKI